MKIYKWDVLVLSLCLSARSCLRKYQFPHLIISAERGVIDGVRLDGNSRIIDSDRGRSLVHRRPYVAELPGDKITHRRKWYEAILEIRYREV